MSALVFNPTTLPRECQVMLDVCELVDRESPNKKSSFLRKVQAIEAELRSKIDAEIVAENFEGIDPLLDEYNRVLNAKTFIEVHITEDHDRQSK